MAADIFGMDFIWVLVVVVVLFGGSQLPKLAKNAGEAMKEFRKVHDEASGTAQSVADQSSAPQSPPSAPPQVPVPRSIAPAAMPGTPQPALAVGDAASVETGAEQVTLNRAELDALLVAARETAAETSESPTG